MCTTEYILFMNNTNYRKNLVIEMKKNIYIIYTVEVCLDLIIITCKVYTIKKEL